MKVKLNTSYGDILLALDTDKAPITTENFLSYVKSGHYDGTIFHRVVSDFVVQGGGMGEDMKEKPTQAPIKNEANNGVSNMLGTVAMARTADPDSASAQFFINMDDNAFLNFSAETTEGWGYCVFAKVVEGMETVEKIAMQATISKNGHQNVPQENILIKQAVVIAE